MINKAIYTEDDTIIIVDDHGRTIEYNDSEEVINLNQEFNNSEYLNDLKNEYEVDINRTKVSKIATIIVGLLNLGIAISLTHEFFGTNVIFLNGLGAVYYGAIIVGVPMLVRRDNKKIKEYSMKKSFIEDEIVSTNIRIHEIIKNVKMKSFDDLKKRRIVNFDRVDKDLKKKINYKLEDTNYDEKAKVYTLKPSKRR